MALINCAYFSPTLGFNTNIYVVIPSVSADEVQNKKDISAYGKGVKYQVLYLLHGAFGNYSDWIRGSNIERYAVERRLAVVMPSVENSYYQNMYRGLPYLNYVKDELPEFIQTLFPVSDKREDTFVAGLSMGGYGALRVAFEKPQSYAACASLSGAIDIQSSKNRHAAAANVVSPIKWDLLLEDPDHIDGSEADLYTLIAKRIGEGGPLPKVFQTCGTEDFIYRANVKAHEKLLELGIDLTYEEHPGIHDWNYWDKHIQRVLDWLPLKRTSIRG